MFPTLNPTLYPSETEFSARFNRGESQLIWTSCPADLDTPVSAMLRLMEEGKPSFLLESVEKGEIRGRYSIIGLMPDLIWRCMGNKAEICYSDIAKEGEFIPCSEGSLASLRKLYEDSKIDIPEGLPPMSSGLVGTMGYDMVKLMEDLPSTKPDSIAVPDACFIRPKIMVIFDAVTDKIFIITSIYVDKKRDDAKIAYAAAAKRITYVLDRLSAPVPNNKNQNHTPVSISDFTSNTTRTQYDEMLERAREYIRSGDIFQVVISQRFSAKFTLPPFALYRALRQLNPSPFLFYLHLGSYTLVGSSPEILVRLRDGEVTIRPIAGTRKRGRNKQEDAELAADLLADPKEVSEHLMLLDLGRNDVGRVAKIGSVKTTNQMSIENYSHVMHIVSNVIGELDPKYDALSALIAGFPAGTVSGAPKIRAMEIIDELETEARSFYAGCIGYFSGNGNMDTAITLRTGLIKDGVLHVQAGGGIVAESVTEDEYQEALNKSRALMRAAEEAIKFI
ncbi:MAG: anthranilate synthase component I [Rickettsiales bacterium]|jgi:anthranilate synthase component 1